MKIVPRDEAAKYVREAFDAANKLTADDDEFFDVAVNALYANGLVIVEVTDRAGLQRAMDDHPARAKDPEA